ncbi:Vacuolar protein sorting-associated protein 52 A [Lasiodiplodia hormozganensis]|uniref:Vacuolar protein sorting-associated protein 52 A n=1 Tax=Lasiodiplodia hormozganensis TaxID=869390 RepID=A0AA40C8F3_9PEZI|nr:Vacuolar protein sorting-associated protein 52 A [Lasiodiplodia hormozganensis]
MWFASHSAQPSPAPSPSPARSYSPAPNRRPYLTPLPQRSGVNPRSSSLSLLSPTSSTSSLPNQGRLPNGSGLRVQINSSPPADVPDPQKVLEDILGGPPKRQLPEQNDESAGAAVERPSEIAENIDFGGLSLAAFANAECEPPRQPTGVQARSAESVEEYTQASDKFEDLHRSVTACDEVLKSVETYLTGFQADLGAVSAEIETLQNRSLSLTTKLENRKVVEKLLGPAVEENSISPAVVRRIAEGPVDESFSKALQELEKRSKAVNAKSNDDSKVKALNDLKPLLVDLTNKAVERVRDYIVAQIKALRSPSINAQIIQQQGFLKYKDLYAFLARHQKKLADELCQAYVNTMRWYYLNHFTRYHEALQKVKLHVIDQHDAMGSENQRRGAMLSSAKVPTTPHDAFSIGRRLDLLRGSHHNALTLHVLEEDKATHYLELPFHTFNIALIDNAAFEYTFLTSYFSPSQSYHEIGRTFAQIFEPTFALGRQLTKSLIDTSMDALGILLSVRLNQHFAFEMQRRKVPAAEGYINGTNMLLWPRFQQVMDTHCKSIQALTASLPGRPAASTSILASSSTSASDAQSTAPVALTQRFANFLHGVLALSSEAADDEPVSNSLWRLRIEYEAYLQKRSKGIAEQRKKERFLFNNYSLVGTILEGTGGRLAEEMRTYFVELRDQHKEGA